MKEILKIPADPGSPITLVSGSEPARHEPQRAQRLLGFILWMCLLSVLFFKPLSELARFAATNELHSQILLIPFISFYLILLKGKGLTARLSSSPRLALVPMLFGLLAAGWSWAMVHQNSRTKPDDYLPIAIFAFLAFIICGCFLFLGSQLTKAIWFPIAFLFLMVPFPPYVMDGIEVFLQHASADAADLLFTLSGTLVFRDELVFYLPGHPIEVAKECSGIRSTLALFITSIVAGQIFLRSPWRRAILTMAIVPIGIIRNAFRIVTIALLTIYVDPQTINGPLHKKGGPLFFILSLVAFFALLLLLRRAEGRKAPERQTLDN